MKVNLKKKYLIIYEKKNHYVETYEEFLDVFALPYLEDTHEKEEFLSGLVKILAIIKNISKFSKQELITYSKDKTYLDEYSIDEEKLVNTLNKVGLAQIFIFVR